jgi:hypothetical protein
MAGLLSKPKLPPIAPPTPMPDTQATTLARRRTIAKESASQGYTSTLLSAGGRETMGG